MKKRLWTVWKMLPTQSRTFRWAGKCQHAWSAFRSPLRCWDLGRGLSSGEQGAADPKFRERSISQRCRPVPSGPSSFPSLPASSPPCPGP